MISIYLLAAFWFLSALISTIIANRLKISNALMEIIIGAIIGFIAFKIGFTNQLELDADWLKFIAGVAAIMLTFLAGSELKISTYCLFYFALGTASQFVNWYCSINNFNGCCLCCHDGIWFQ